jgi:TetR/AcrR family transcriptional regulator, repressor for uid operon
MNFDDIHHPLHSDAAQPERGVRAEKREAQLARILGAARKCFVQSGFRGASMHDICREADMSPGALYRYFPSKESIIEAIAEQDRQTDVANMMKIGNGPTLIDGFMSAIMAHFQDLHDRGMAPLFTEIRAESMRNEAVAACCAKTENQFIAIFHAFLEQAKTQKLIDPVAEVDAIVPIIMALGEGMIMSDILEKGVKPEEIETILRAMTIAILRPQPSDESQNNA